VALAVLAPSLVAPTGSPTRGRGRMALVGPAAALVVAVGAVGVLAASALADGGGPIIDSAAAPVDVRLAGTLDTAGLAGGGTTTSTVTVHNDGHIALRWSIAPEVAGSPALAAALEVTVTPGACGSPSGAPVPARATVTAPLAAGTATPACIRLSLPAAAARDAGTLDVAVQVRAVAA
jgi:hypothetical protein